LTPAQRAAIEVAVAMALCGAPPPAEWAMHGNGGDSGECRAAPPKPPLAPTPVPPLAGGRTPPSLLQAMQMHATGAGYDAQALLLDTESVAAGSCAEAGPLLLPRDGFLATAAHVARGSVRSRATTGTNRRSSMSKSASRSTPRRALKRSRSSCRGSPMVTPQPGSAAARSPRKAEAHHSRTRSSPHALSECVGSSLNDGGVGLPAKASRMAGRGLPAPSRPIVLPDATDASGASGASATPHVVNLLGDVGTGAVDSTGQPAHRRLDRPAPSHGAPQPPETGRAGALHTAPRAPGVDHESVPRYISMLRSALLDHTQWQTTLKQALGALDRS
jgi:hypothetical protein